MSRMVTMEDCKFKNMSNANFERFLYDYSKTRSGEIAELTREAALRIGILAARLEVLEGSDDLK